MSVRRIASVFRVAAQPITIVAVTVALALAAGWVFRDEISRFLYHREVHSGSQSELVAIRDVGELETLAFVRRTVFPHDYLLPDTDVTRIVGKISELEAGARVSPEEELHLAAANLAAELGLATRREQTDYVVVTTVMRFGYTVDTLVDTLERGGDSSTARQRSGDSAATEGGQTASEARFSALPAAEILSVSTEDLSREAYPYGPVPLDADGWRRVAEFVSTRYPQEEKIKDLRRQARDHAITFLDRLLRPE